jgi:hypothetical protein
VTSSSVPLSWTASNSTGVTGYRIYRGSSTTPLNSTPVTTTSYTDTTVAAGTTYSYTVTAIGSGGVESARSTALSVTTPGASGGGGGIVNGTFEANNLTGWTTTGTATVTATGHTGSYSAQLGSTSPTGDSTIAQTFTAPAGTTSLSFWRLSTCPDTVQYDWATATLLDNTAGTTSTPLAHTCATNTSWVQTTASIIAGHSYTLTLANHDDNYAGDATYTRYDDITLG